MTFRWKYVSLDSLPWQLELDKARMQALSLGLLVGLSFPQLSLTSCQDIHLLMCTWWQMRPENPYKFSFGKKKDSLSPIVENAITC